MSTTQHPKGRDCERTEEVLNNYRDRAIAAESALAAIPEPIGYAVVNKDGDPVGMPESNYDEADQFRSICDARDDFDAPHLVVALVPVEVPNEQ